MAIWIFDCDNASTEDIQRGIDAAKKVFEEAGVTPDEAKQADEAWPTVRYPNHMENIWPEAEMSALDACCKNWLSIPEAAHLELEG